MNFVSWEPEGHYCKSKMFCWEPEGRYRHRLCTAIIAPFWFSMEHLWTSNNALLALNWRYVDEWKLWTKSWGQMNGCQGLDLKLNFEEITYHVKQMFMVSTWAGFFCLFACHVSCEEGRVGWCPLSPSVNFNRAFLGGKIKASLPSPNKILWHNPCCHKSITCNMPMAVWFLHTHWIQNIQMLSSAN